MSGADFNEEQEEDVEDELHDIDFDTVNAYSQDNPFTYIDVLQQSSLIQAIYANKLEAVKAILEDPAKRHMLNDVDNQGCNAIFAAVKANNKKILEFLLSQPDANKNARSWEGDTPLLASLRPNGSDYEIVATLVHSGCDVTIPNNENVTPLHFAMMRDSSDIGQLLLDNGADINAAHFDGFTPLHEAIFNDCLENVYMLLAYGADVYVKTSLQVMPITMAIDLIQDDTLLDILVEYIRDLDEFKAHGQTVLFQALQRHKKIALDLIKRGANMHFTQQGTSCMHLIITEWTSDVFNLAWNKLNLRKFFRKHPKFLLDFCINCTYDSKDFIDCLLLMLSSRIAQDLCEHIAIKNLLNKLNSLNVQKDVRVNLIYLLLTLGTLITYDDLNCLYELYKHNEELEIFFKMNLEVVRPIIPVFYHSISMLVVDISTVPKTMLDDTLYYLLQIKWYSTIMEIGRFYTIKPLMNKYEEFPEYDIFIKQMHNVPSLTELSRNAIRKAIATNFDAKRPFNYYTELQKLCFPKLIIDIICLKVPIYNYVE